MLKNMLLASAAAFVVLGSAASLTNMKAVITSGNGADAALTQEAFELSTRMREMREEQVRQATLLSVQETTIRRLQRDIARAEKIALAPNAAMAGSELEEDSEQWSIGLDMPSAERAEQAAAYHAAWRQALELDTELNAAHQAYRTLEAQTGARIAALENRTDERIAALEKDHRFEVDGLVAEIEQRDNSIVGLMHRIVSLQSGRDVPVPEVAAQPAEDRMQSRPKPAAVPAAVRKAPEDEKADAGAVQPEPSPETTGQTGHTVADGAAAYHAGDYAKAFEIWRVLADKGDARARFHLGALYFEGRGVPRQLETAHLLLGMAAAAGHDGAVALRDKVAAELEKSQLAKVPGAVAR